MDFRITKDLFNWLWVAPNPGHRVAKYPLNSTPKNQGAPQKEQIISLKYLQISATNNAMDLNM